LALKYVTQSGGETALTVENKGELPLSIYITIMVKDGKKSIQRYTAETWKTGVRQMTVCIKKPLSSTASIEFGNELIPDNNKNDNSWTALKK
jgi:hypothetical protein